MINVKRLQNVYFVATDVQGTAAFYGNVFGFTTKFSDADRWTQFDVVGSGFSIASPDEGVDAQSGAVPVFEVETIDGIDALVIAHHGTVVERRDMGEHGLVMTIKDPAGNAIQLFCRTKR